MSVEIVRSAPSSAGLDKWENWQLKLFNAHVALWIFCWIATRVTYAALPVMLLWNWVMPHLVNANPIDFWHALGLSLLCTALFKSNVLEEQKNKFIPALERFLEEEQQATVLRLARRMEQNESKSL